ncbi:amidase [Actinacidiphila sp. bgisy144]|uniref:amidase n=1 Tax=Actinacidiphila sp. bgisy144 TaxID=3413791 RepID=UPI003EBBCD82
MPETHDLTALEQGALVAAGDLSPVELVEHYLKRIDRIDRHLGAYVTVAAGTALAQARRREGQALAARRSATPLPPLFGVPVPVKDSVRTAGIRTTFGSAAFADHVPAEDDDAAALLAAAGTVLLGKTNTPEFELSGHTENRVAPPARTPWHPERSAGGSSGGSAAAVAAGLAPLAHGSDSAGSVRGPASACGLYGFKPSRGLVSAGPRPWDVSGLTTAGALSRTVRDAAALLDAMAGPPGSPPGGTFLAAAGQRPGRLRVGLVTRSTVPGAEVHPECRAAAEEAAELLTRLGHHVEPAELPAGASIARVFPPVWGVLAASRPVPERSDDLLMPLTRHVRRQGREVSGVGFAEALQGFHAVDRAMDPLRERFDLLLTPTLAQPPQPVGALREEDDPAAEALRTVRNSPFTALYNVTGRPAASLPLHWTADGLPVGVMLAADRGADALLLAVSAQLEEAAPWNTRRPPLWSSARPETDGGDLRQPAADAWAAGRA